MGRMKDFLDRKKDGTYIFLKPENIFYLLGTYIEGSALVVSDEWRLLVHEMHKEEAEELDNVLLCRPMKAVQEIEHPFLEPDAPAWLVKKTGGEVDRTVEEMREVKSREETEKIIEAQKETWKFMEDLADFAYLGMGEMRERDISARMLSLAEEAGFQLSFHPIVASAGNSSRPHHKPGNASIEGYLLLDIGIRKDWYCGDMSRPVLLDRPSEEIEDAIQKVLEARDALKAEGKTLEELTKEAEMITGKMPHLVGHGIGLEVHERISGTVRDGNVITMEPGIYKEGEFGVRIEDIYIAGKGLVKIGKEVIELY